MMDDYRLCDLCRTVRFDLLSQPGGFQHYKDVKLLIAEAKADPPCRLCRCLFEALQTCLREDYSKKSLTEIANESLHRLHVRLEMHERSTPHQERAEGSLLTSRTWSYNTCDGLIVGCGGWDRRTKWWTGLYVYPGYLTAYPQQGYNFMPAHGGSNECFEIVHSWMRDCNAHPGCVAALNATEFFPSRVIDVGPSDGSQEPFLFVPKATMKDPVRMGCADRRYVALSYCWGSEGNLTTTSSTLPLRKQRLPMRDLPRKIHDAVVITRRLEVRFLWVDALCILQGDDAEATKDWQVCSATMDQIYGNAFITIAAAAANNVHQGILNTREVPKLVRLANGNQDSAAYITVDITPVRRKRNDPLYKRSWAFQEGILSTRVLTYRSAGMLWKCLEKQCFEDGCHEQHLDDITELLGPQDVTNRARLKDCDVQHMVSDTWHSIVKYYSETVATYEADKLPALSSLAKAIQGRTGDEYLAGCWKRSLKSDLGWFTYNGVTPSRYLAPTWSWASVHGKVFFSEHVEDLDFPFTLVDYNITREGSDVFGRVTDGWILVKAMMTTRHCIVRRDGLVPWGITLNM